MFVRDTTPEEAQLAAPQADGCDRCGSTSDLRQLVFRGRSRYAERTVCDECAETLFESFIDTASAPTA
jgi:recombinational DNA repair protein (RecF pathway)